MKREIKGYKPLTLDGFIKEIRNTMLGDGPITYFKVQRDLVVDGERVGYVVLESLKEDERSACHENVVRP